MGIWQQAEPAPVEPTEEEKAEQARLQRLQEIKDELAATDYLALKAYEGEDMSEHPQWKEKRAELREEYRRLEAYSDPSEGREKR